MSVSLIAEIVFGVTVGVLCYTYAGYPCVLILLSKIVPRPVKKSDRQPTVSLIITAYNEELDLAAKLENTLCINYPKELLEIIVASDCSTDGTDDIVRSFANRSVRLHRQPVRRGKTAAQNAAVEIAAGEVILFSDATTMYAPDVLQKIVPNFADGSVGCVAGQLIYVDPSTSATGRGARSYWGYELFLRRHESRVCSLIGASGCLYAVRRSAYKPLNDDACSDFIIATKMVEQGLRAVFESDAVCFEETNRRSDKEMRMRIRVIAQTFNDLWQHRGMMNPNRSGFYAIELLSHKILRYLMPVFLVILLASSILLAQHSWFYFAIAILQLAFYATAAFGFVLERAGIHSRLTALPQYFTLGNLAIAGAFYKFMRGEQYVRWEPIREQRSTESSLSGVSKS